MSNKIPNIIHQLWIGPRPPPTKHMDTWRDKNPNFNYIRWTEEKLKKHKIPFSCLNRINEIEEINGKADIIRWELLYHFGGVFIDADSICVSSIDEILMNTKCFAGWENEEVRKGLIATGTMGFPPKHPLVKAAIDFIIANPVSYKQTGARAWLTVGPGLLTRLYDTGKFKDITVFPSYYFLPIHCTKLEYQGHGKIYAHQEWGSTKRNYDEMDSKTLPEQFMPPPAEKAVSVLVSSYNTKALYIKECLDSIRDQEGYFNIELVWINDGSDKLNTTLLKKHLDNFKKTTRFINVVYSENDGNKGIGHSLNKGIHLCNHEIIIKLDSDDIMVPNRIEKQFKYMEQNPDTAICGAQILMFKGTEKNHFVNITKHPTITWNDYIKDFPHWFVNHPTVCYRKSKVLEVGNYSINLKETWGNDDLSHDFELELRMLKKYGKIYNFPEHLVLYRLHPNQVTHQGGKGGPEYWGKIRKDIIKNLL